MPGLINLIINHNLALTKERQFASMENKLISRLQKCNIQE